jgi:hypothetical protein
MNRTEKKLVTQACVTVFVGLTQFVMLGVCFIYAVTHW